MVRITPEISPGSRLKATRPNSGTTSSLERKPRSPPVSALGPSECVIARVAKSAPPAAFFLTASAIFRTESSVLPDG